MRELTLCPLLCPGPCAPIIDPVPVVDRSFGASGSSFSYLNCRPGGSRLDAYQVLYFAQNTRYRPCRDTIPAVPDKFERKSVGEPRSRFKMG